MSFFCFPLVLVFCSLSLVPSRWRWSRVFALRSHMWRRLHDSITCWWQNLQKHPLLLSIVFSSASVCMCHLVLTLFFNISTRLSTEIREFLCCYCCCCYFYRVMLLFRPWIRKKDREQKYDVFIYWRTIEKTLYTYNAIEKTSIEEGENVKFIKENIRYLSNTFCLFFFYHIYMKTIVLI